MIYLSNYIKFPQLFAIVLFELIPKVIICINRKKIFYDGYNITA